MTLNILTDYFHRKFVGTMEIKLFFCVLIKSWKAFCSDVCNLKLCSGISYFFECQILFPYVQMCTLTDAETVFSMKQLLI